MNNIKYDIVGYTDGSAIPNPGLSGYGVHMYIYNNDEKNKPKSVLGKCTVTNKGYISRTLFKSNKDEDIIEVPIYKVIDVYGYEKNCNTNNTAELYAVYNMLKAIVNPLYEDVIHDISSVFINIDSTYVINGVTKIMDGVDVHKNINANQDIFLELDKVIKLVKAEGITITLNKVKGHSGLLGNERADMLADMGRLLRKSSIKDSDYKIVIEDRADYYGNRIERDPMLSASLLFNYNISEYKAGEGHFYCTVNYKDETDIGKPNHNTVYGILYSETEYVELKELSKLSNMVLDNYDTPNALLLNNYYNKEVYNNLRLYGTDYTVYTNRIFKRLNTVDDVEIVKEIYPVGTSYKAFNNNEELISYLNQYRVNESPSNHIILDITDNYFVTNDKGKTILNPEMKNDKYSIKINIKPYTGYGKKLKIVTGLDVLKRNPLKRLEKDNVKIDLVIIKYKTYFKYFTITSTTDSVTGNKKYLLISNYYSNTLYF